MLTTEQTQQFSDILEAFGTTLDITATQHNMVVKSYEAVGTWLSKEGSLLIPYEPEILPQGSFMLETMIKPIHENDDLDIDLVCQLKGKAPDWTQYDLKQKVGDQLKKNEAYKEMLEVEGRRCWTLKYSDSANYHLDILPSIVSNDYKTVIAKSFSESVLKYIDNLAIRITDNKEPNYRIARDPDEWLKSNPFGFSRWFFQQADLSLRKSGWILESVQPVPNYRQDKLPLQRVVQILKRHRDIMFNGDDDKPISMIITTLAARAYQKESNVTDALLNVIQRLPSQIEERYSEKHRKMIKWIANPVNAEENYADKWPEKNKRQENFYKWLYQLNADMQKVIQQREMKNIQESFEKPFGKEIIAKAFSNYGDMLRRRREGGSLRMATGTGMLGTIGTTVKGHNFHGR
jgi:hypothetical protein